MARKDKGLNGMLKRFNRRVWRYSLWIWIIVVVALVLLSSRYVSGVKDSSSGAVAQTAQALEQVKMPGNVDYKICTYIGYTSYFSPKLHIPLCVIYELTAEEAAGTQPRYQGQFICDESVEGCPKHDDYTYSGYDRGHMAPSGDMKWSEEAMRQSFYLTNICPQIKALNTGQWNTLESRVREWVKRDSTLIVATGPIIGDKYETIGDNDVAVPEKFYKVILAPNANPPRAIAFVYANAKPDGKLEQHAVSVDYVEAATGIDFFSALDDDVESEVESQCYYQQWNVRAK